MRKRKSSKIFNIQLAGETSYPEEVIRVVNLLPKKRSSFWFRKIGVLLSVIAFILIQSQLFSAYEAHVINVTAHICNYSETRTMGYWKTHPSVYLPLLSQWLGAPGGDDEIKNKPDVDEVFDDYNLSMRNKLRGQLLAMKFNIAHFGIGGYIPENSTGTLDQIVAEADNLLRQDPPPSDSVLEDMKDLLDGLNNLHQISYCRNSYPLAEPTRTILSTITGEKNSEPETFIYNYPEPETTALEAQFEFGSSVTSATFQCKVNFLNWVNCTSPQTFSGLIPGDYLFQVFATDSRGKYDSTSATYSWKILEGAGGSAGGFCQAPLVIVNPETTTSTETNSTTTDNGTTTDSITTDNGSATNTEPIILEEGSSEESNSTSSSDGNNGTSTSESNSE